MRLWTRLCGVLRTEAEQTAPRHLCICEAAAAATFLPCPARHGTATGILACAQSLPDDPDPGDFPNREARFDRPCHQLHAVRCILRMQLSRPHFELKMDIWASLVSNPLIFDNLLQRFNCSLSVFLPIFNILQIRTGDSRGLIAWRCLNRSVPCRCVLFYKDSRGQGSTEDGHKWMAAVVVMMGWKFLILHWR